MKRTEIYKKIYRLETSPDPKDRGEMHIINPDIIGDELTALCIVQKADSDLDLVQHYKYLYSNGKALVGINLRGCKSGEEYRREIRLEIMPSEAETPKELSDLLESNQFEKLDKDY